jgi:integrase/recombinase XerD
LLGAASGPRETGVFVPMLVHTRRGRLGADGYSPVRMPFAGKPPVTLSQGQVERLVAACAPRRDRFLLILLDQTGLRLGEALGLRHADLRLRAGEIAVVARDDNVNGARVKGLKARVVPAGPAVFDAYADYMEAEYGALDSDWVFVNLFRPPLGAPMTADSVGVQPVGDAGVVGAERCLADGQRRRGQPGVKAPSASSWPIRGTPRRAKPSSQ